MSHIMAVKFLSDNAHKWDVICITNSDELIHPDIQKYSKGYLHLIFDDIDTELQIENYVPPSKIDVKKALDYAEGKDRLVVTCPNGMSRSSAIAYAIRCKKCGIPKAALNILDVRHYPNKLVIKYAAELMDSREIYDVYFAWGGRPTGLFKKLRPI